MSKDKQIEEMAEVLRHSCENECFRNEDGFIDCEACEACLLYEQGYRKQSEAEWTYGKNNTMKCTRCRRRMPKIILARFCPNCGAKIKGV